MVWKARFAAVASMLMILLAGRSLAEPTSRPAHDSVPSISAEDQKVEDLLDRHLPRIGLPGVPLSDSIDYIRAITGANIYVDWQAVGLAGVTKDFRVNVDATNIPLRQAFIRILEGTGSNSLEIQAMHGAIVVSTKLDFADRKAQIGPYLADLSDVQSAAFLDKRLAQVELPLRPLSDAIDYLRDVTGAQILVKWQVLSAAGIDKNTEVTFAAHNISLSSVLYFILDQAGDGKLGYTAKPCEGMLYDKKLKKHVPASVALITISTIDDLEADKTQSTTRPN
jgi:hypothetical protein